ncbi:glycoside hydrolase family 18 [Trichoderma reesei QM6a]|uniref:chitinase n=3 Tax=Hypocrea jecorina TaxID=51453 RepID=G0RBA1_HYPJQ|nr:glycoside hydrolase family 18 [Trichoderma reesei QM6a]EGR51275.1 glycoside hydrolase family 18 [Trichoderma reesei QM6a]ETS04324.1 chitinase 18-11 [Trichoderma reesei RUT C-30]DAA05859.1 TPA: chitinase 18-11 [Trichoderma reesei]
MQITYLAAAAIAATGALAKPRFVMYFDQWHKDSLPDHSVTAGVTHVTTAFADSVIFNSGTWYSPFMAPDQVRSLFDTGTKLCLAVGGWGQSAGFDAAAKTDETRQLYAKNVADTIKNLGYDCVDIDWEYPGGNGEDYKVVPNSEKAWEIEAYPLFLEAVRKALPENIELSIAVPARVEDMMAFTAENVAKINGIVNYVNIMTYDLMNRRMNETTHHTSVNGSLNSVNTYLERGLSPDKINLGFAFYAKWFSTEAGYQCTTPTGCPTALLENPDGSDPLVSGAITFEASTYAGKLEHAVANGIADEEEGGQWWWDAAEEVYWTWDTADLVARKFSEIVVPKKLGGVFAWSLAQDSYDWSRFKALQAGVRGMEQKQDD